MNDEIFLLGAMDKIAASSNPAAPQKKSLGDGPIDMGLKTPYLNQGGGQAGQQTAGAVDRSVPKGAYLNSPPGTMATPQEAGGLGVHSSPDNGDLGMKGGGGDHSVTKSAAFQLGAFTAVDIVYGDDEG